MKFATCLIVSGILLFSSSPTFAAPSVKEVSSKTAQGLNGPAPGVHVWSGYGTNISFIQSGETIKKVWLDDPSRVALSFDGPMCMGLGSGGEGNCANSSASVIHLKRIKALKFENIPSSGSGTLLTVITEGAAGRKLYQFKIVYGTGQPSYNTLKIIPDAPTIPPQSYNPQTGLQYIRQGLSRAEQRGLIDRSNKLWGQIQAFIFLAEKGEPVELAARKVNIPLPLISRLAELGNYNSVAKMPSAETTGVIQAPTATRSTPESFVAIPKEDKFPKPSSPPSGKFETSNERGDSEKNADYASFDISKTSKAIKSQLSPSQPKLVPDKPSSEKNQVIASLKPTVLPEPKTKAAPDVNFYRREAETSIDQANAIVRGLIEAGRRGEINYQTLMYRRVQTVISLLRRGNSRNDAAKSAGVPLKVVEQLIAWGERHRPVKLDVSEI